MSEQTPPIPDIVAAFDADALTPEIVSAWAHHPHVCIGTLELACIDSLTARCEALEQENAAQAEQITDLAKALREVQDTAAGFKASLSNSKQKQEPT